MIAASLKSESRKTRIETAFWQLRGIGVEDPSLKSESRKTRIETVADLGSARLRTLGLKSESRKTRIETKSAGRRSSSNAPYKVSRVNPEKQGLKRDSQNASLAVVWASDQVSRVNPEKQGLKQGEVPARLSLSRFKLSLKSESRKTRIETTSHRPFSCNRPSVLGLKSESRKTRIETPSHGTPDIGQPHFASQE